MLNRSSGTHPEDLKDPEKVLFPSGNLILNLLRNEEYGNHVSFSLLEYTPLDLCQGSTIEALVSRSLGEGVAGLTHVVRSPMPSRTGSLSSPNDLPSNLL